MKILRKIKPKKKKIIKHLRIRKLMTMYVTKANQINIMRTEQAVSHL